MRLLVVTYQFPPNANPRALRWSALAEHWARRGDAIDVVCGVPSAGHDAPPFETLRVHRVGFGLLGRLRQKYGRAAAGNAGSIRDAAPRRPLLRAALQGGMSLLRRVHDATWKQLHWPDYAAGWYRPALRCATELLEQNAYDGVVTVSNPFTAHRIGLSLKRRFPAIHWVADVGDPFSIDDRFRANNHFLYASRNRRFERRVIYSADAVTIVTDSMTAAYRRHFPSASMRMQTVQPLAPALPAELSLPPVHSAESPRRLAYFGTLYRGLRSPSPLLNLFRLLIEMPGLDDLELHFYGNTGDCNAEFERFGDLLGEKIFRHGPIPRERVAETMHGSHVLVNIGNDLAYGLPSKVVEYASTGRPILNISVSEDDTSARFLRDYPAALSLSVGDVSTARLSWREIATFFRKLPQASPHEVRRLLQPHRMESVAEQYERAIFPNRDSGLRAA